MDSSPFIEHNVFENSLWFWVYKLLEENIGKKNICNLRLGRDVLDRTLEALIIKLKEKDKTKLSKLKKNKLPFKRCVIC